MKENHVLNYSQANKRLHNKHISLGCIFEERFHKSTLCLEPPLDSESCSGGSLGVDYWLGCHPRRWGRTPITRYRREWRWRWGRRLSHQEKSPSILRNLCLWTSNQEDGWALDHPKGNRQIKVRHRVLRVVRTRRDQNRGLSLESGVSEWAPLFPLVCL